MKRLLTLLTLLLMFSVFAAAQATQVPTCNGFNATGVPIDTKSGSTVCTDFFGVGNWANSPLPAGTITGYTLISAGSGYTNPVVVINDITGSGATATATFDSTGAITGITGSLTGNYTMPQVTIVDTNCGGAGQPVCGSGAMATAIIGAPFQGGGMLKFQDALPDLKLAIANPDTTTFPGSDFYVIGLVQYQTKMHASLPPTTLRGYCQLANASATTCLGQSYLGPVILAQKNRPVRVLFKNMLSTGAGGDLFIPMDQTFMGADPLHQNRATLHLHGGATPWISDGTPHQWTTPIGDSPLKGVSTQNVPDMYFDSTGNIVPLCTASLNTNCYPNGIFTGTLPTGATNQAPPGEMTFYWTNQQGGRLMFYHDHAYGITRLNVYVGEAAGYLLYDPVEETALANAGMPGSITAGDLPHLIPLVIQDKTFVPSPAQIGVQDPTWAGAFGTTPGAANTGDLWFPHVYMPNQDPNDPTGGANGFGRWDYGAWFFPPQTSLTGGPSVTIPCTSAAFPGQVLSPVAPNNNQGCPIIPNPSGTPESFMDTPVINGKAYPVLHVAPEAYRFKILSAGNDRSWNLSWFIADATQNNTEVAMLPAVPPSSGSAVPLCGSINPLAVPMLDIGLATGLLDGSGNPLNGTGLAAGCWPNYGPQPGIPKPQAMWAADGRAGGAPDPRNAGPAWVQIGSEGGLLPTPVVIPPTAINYEQNVRSITIGSVAVHGLWLGPAERADVIVDFSKFAGKTLILYNDAPTPAPASDSRLDYFTGDGDQSPIGGAPNTPAGYGPNTRTIMQVMVDAPTAGGHSLSLPSLKAAFATTAAGAGLFATTQPTTIVPEPNYNSAYNGNFPPMYSGIGDGSMTFTPITPLNFESLLAEEPSACANVTTTPPVQCGTYNHKAIQELFTLDYGRMNATLGTELPNVNFTNQTTIPLGYVDPATEIIRQGDTQLWKITHNGVDSHFIHFHLFNVQVVNRVGWDGSLRPPDANEMGWKDTVRMNPLEDILVALQPITPALPWPIQNSVRNNDVTGSGMFTNLNPFSNAGANTVDGPTNFGWEYVWHCHILGHEENDMMRPMVFQVPPPAPSNLNAVLNGGQINLSWTDNSASETGFEVQRDVDPNFPASTTILVAASQPNTVGEGTTWGETITYTDTVGSGGPYYYRVRAIDDGFSGLHEQSYDATAAMYSGFSNIASAGAPPNATVSTGPLTFGNIQLGTTSASQQVTVSNTGGSPLGVLGISFTGANPGDFVQTNNCGTVAVGSSCTINVSFRPTAIGGRVAFLTINTNDPNHLIVNVGLSGTGLGPVAALSPITVPFGNQFVGTTSAAQTVKLSNTGNSGLTFTSSTTGQNAGDFTITGGTCTGSLPANSSCSITLGFKPSAAGARVATLSVASTDPLNPIVVTSALSGTGIAPVASVSPTSLNFGNQKQQQTSPPQSVTLSNTGTAPLTISSIAIGGTNAGDFKQTNNCGTSLAVGANCTVSVTFKPAKKGARSATLTITDNSNAIANSKQNVSLSGIGQ